MSARHASTHQGLPSLHTSVLLPSFISFFLLVLCLLAVVERRTDLPWVGTCTCSARADKLNTRRLSFAQDLLGALLFLTATLWRSDLASSTRVQITTCPSSPPVTRWSWLFLEGVTHATADAGLSDTDQESDHDRDHDRDSDRDSARGRCSGCAAEEEQTSQARASAEAAADSSADRHYCRRPRRRWYGPADTVRLRTDSDQWGSLASASAPSKRNASAGLSHERNQRRTSGPMPRSQILPPSSANTNNTFLHHQQPPVTTSPPRLVA